MKKTTCKSQTHKTLDYHEFSSVETTNFTVIFKTGEDKKGALL